MLAVYLPGSSWLHRLAALPKLLILLLMTALAFYSSTLWTSCLLLLFVTAIVISVPNALRSLLSVGKAIAWMSVVLLIAHALLGDLATGLAVTIRSLALFALALLLNLTTPWQELLALLERLLQPLSKLGIDSASLALLISLVMRFIPVLLTQWARLSCSWQARSPHRPSWQLIAPWCLHALSVADHSDDCLKARVPLKNRNP